MERPQSVTAPKDGVHLSGQHTGQEKGAVSGPKRQRRWEDSPGLAHTGGRSCPGTDRGLAQSLTRPVGASCDRGSGPRQPQRLGEARRGPGSSACSCLSTPHSVRCPPWLGTWGFPPRRQRRNRAAAPHRGEAPATCHPSYHQDANQLALHAPPCSP